MHCHTLHIAEVFLILLVQGKECDVTECVASVDYLLCYSAWHASPCVLLVLGFKF